MSAPICWAIRTARSSASRPRWSTPATATSIRSGACRATATRCAECSPKLSYAAYATLTQVLDGTRYDGRLDTGTTSLYALRFRRPDKSLLYAVWNLRGRRKLAARLADGGKPKVIDAVNRPVGVAASGSDLTLDRIGTADLRVRGGDRVNRPGPERPRRSAGGAAGRDAGRSRRLDRRVAAGQGVRGPARVARRAEGPRAVRRRRAGGRPPWRDARGEPPDLDPEAAGGHARPDPRYVVLTAKPGKEISIPKGTTRLAVWVRGNSTWAQVKLGIRNAAGRTRLILDDDLAAHMADNFDGWRLLDTGDLGDEDLPGGSWKLDRIVVTMPEQQVYVDELRTTPKPQVSIWGLRAIRGKLPAVNYLPW